jgi:chromate transporter
LTLILWITPAVFVMTLAAYGMTYLRNRELVQFVLPVGVGLILQAGWMMARKVIKSWMYVWILVATIGIGIMFATPYVFPLVLVLGGMVSSFNFREFPRQNKHKMVIPWANFHLYWGFLVLLVFVAELTDYYPLHLLENFYRNGSLVFGGGQVLAPVLYTEFVEFKGLIRPDDFLTGMALSQSLPGPIFALTSYLGVLLMKDYGVLGQLAGSAIGALGIFLPGTFLIFFVFRIWGQLKQYRFIRASLAGIQAASVGLTGVAVYTFVYPMITKGDGVSIALVICSFLIAQTERVPAIALFCAALVAGYCLS